LDENKYNRNISENITCYKSDVKINKPEGKQKKEGGSQASERDFYEELLVSMGCVLPIHQSVTTLRQRTRVTARQLDVRMLIIDEIHSILAGTFREERIVLNAIRLSHCT
jgi:hypothetical protein